MSVTHTWKVVVNNGSGVAVVTDTITISGDAEENINISVPANTVGEVVVSMTAADILSFCMEASKAVTVKFNSTTTPVAPTPISLTANQAYAWKNTDPASSPLTNNVTSIYIDNSANAAAVIFKAAFLFEE